MKKLQEFKEFCHTKLRIKRNHKDTLNRFIVFYNSLIKSRLFIKRGIQKRGTECGECKERGECLLEFRGISLRIPGNVLILAFRGMFEKFPGNVIKDSGECSRRFWEILTRFRKIPENAFNFKLIKATFYLKSK